MGYDRFSTVRADYIGRYGFHKPSNVSPSEIFGDVDCVVLEVRGSQILKVGDVRKTFEEILKGNLQIEDRDVVDYCKEKNVPLYVVEPEISKSNYIGGWFQILFSLITGLLFPPFMVPFIANYYAVPNRKRKIRNFFRMLVGVHSYIHHSGLGQGRNDIAARKIEEFIVPFLIKKLKRRVRVGLNYGSYHVGIAYSLRSVKLRDFSLKCFEKFNLVNFLGFRVKYPGFKNGENIGKVYVANFIDGEWKTCDYETRLF
ncbi:hypothetical protein HOE04_03950 [archaeon]|nr:hypothetical protein [archaeon]